MSRTNEQPSQEPPRIDKFFIAIAHAALGKASSRDEIEASLAEFEAQGYHVLQPVRRIWNGERDLKSLSAGLNQPATMMIRRILEHIAQLEPEITEARENVNDFVADIAMVAIGNLRLSDASDAKVRRSHAALYATSEEKLLRLEAGGYHIRAAVHLIWEGERGEAILLKGLEPHESELVQWILSLTIRAEAEFGSGYFDNDSSDKQENNAEINKAPRQGATDENKHSQKSHYPELKGNLAKPPSNGTVVTLLGTMILRTKRKLTSLLSRSSLMRRIILKRATTKNPYLVPVLTLISRAEQLASQARPDPQEALALIEAGQQILPLLSPETDPSLYVGVQFSLGRAYNILFTWSAETQASHLQQAMACFQEALRILTPEMNPQLYAALQAACAGAYDDLSEVSAEDQAANLQRAIVCYQEALRFLTPEIAPREYAYVQGDLGTAYLKSRTGDPLANQQQAIACYQEALRFFSPKDAPLAYATIQNNLGILYYDRHYYNHLLTRRERTTNEQQAIDCFQKALHYWTPEARPHNYALTQLNLGNLYLELSTGEKAENLQRALTCYQEALRFLTPETAPLDYAKTQSMLGLVFSRLTGANQESNMQQALAHCQEALRFLTAEAAPFEYARTQSILAQAYQRLATEDRAYPVQQAIIAYQEALRFFTSETVPTQSRALNERLGHLYFSQGKWQDALTIYKAALHAGEQLYRAGLSTESKEAELAHNIALYHHTAFTAIRCGQPTEALQILEQGKTRLLTEALRLSVPRPMGVPEDAWVTFTKAAASIRVLQTRVTTEMSPGRRDVDKLFPLSSTSSTDRQFPERTQQARSSIQAQKQAVQATNTTLENAIEHIRIYAPHFLRETDFHVAQAFLPDDRTCLVSFCITQEGSAGLLITQHDQAVKVVEVPDFKRTDLLDLIGDPTSGWVMTYLSDQSKSHSMASPMAWKSAMTDTLATLGRCLLDPILSALPRDVRRLVFLPAAQMFLFPLHAVPLFESSSELVCDRYLVSYAPSLEVLVNARTKAKQESLPDLYAVINPAADPQLSFTSKEGATIATLFDHSVIDEGRIATKQRVMSQACRQTYIHFSCHGSYDWSNPTASGLDLADGRLTLAELQQGKIDLSATRLVTLSACETGITDFMKGSAEEYVGIPAGFLLAGVPCVVSSLWSVSDLSTALLMERFYHNHLKNRMDFAAALHEAQRWICTLEIGAVVEYAEQCYEQSGRKNTTLWHWHRHYRSLAEQNPDLYPFAHPYYWAAFTVNGW